MVGIRILMTTISSTHTVRRANSQGVSLIPTNNLQDGKVAVL